MLLVPLAALVFTAQAPVMPLPPPKPDHAADGACHDDVGHVVACDKEKKGPNIAAITGIVGSATTVAGALTAVVVGVAQVPAPWDYWRYAGDLQKAQADFKKHPDAATLKDADRARAGMHKIENALNDQVGLFISSGATLVTSGVGLASSIVLAAGE